MASTKAVTSARSPVILSPAALVRALPVTVLVAVAWAAAWRAHGSIAAGDWLPYAVLGALEVGVVCLSGAAVRPNRVAVLTVGAAIGLAAWAALSLTWAASPELARDEGLLTLFYAFALALPLLTARSEPERLGAVAVVAAGAAALALATAAELRFGSRVLDRYVSGRLAFPISYSNAQAAVFLLGFWPAVVIASRRSLPAVLRAAATGGACAVLAGWLLTQSKGGILGLALSAIVVFALCPARLRLLVPTVLAAVLTSAAAGPLTGPFRADGDVATRAAIEDAGLALLLVALAGLVLGLAYALVDERIETSPATTRRAGIAVLGLFAAACLSGVAMFFVTVDRPVAFFGDKWRSFKHLPAHERAESHLLSLGSNRYDFWRVSLKELERRPIWGIGARGFGADYLRNGRSEESPARAHSLPIEVLGEQGLVGFGLLVLALGAPLVLTGRSARRGHPAAIACLGAGTYFAGHALVDWIWTFPAVGVLAFLLLGVGVGAGRGTSQPLRSSVAVTAGIAAVLAALLLLAPPWVSGKLTNRALDREGDTASELRWARRLDAVSTAPYVAESELASSPLAAIPPLRQALRKEPRSAALHYLLGTTYLDARRPRDAVRELERAEALAPRDAFIAEALLRARRQR